MHAKIHSIAQDPTRIERTIQISWQQLLHIQHMNNFPDDCQADAETCLK
jgi:hypothetical protein